MGLLDALRGRTKPKRPNLDSLFSVPTAAITMETTLGMPPTGLGSVCFRAAEGGASATTQSEAEAVIEANDGPQVERSVDSFGFTWLLVQGDPRDVSGLVTDLHSINTALEMEGFSTGLLCSIVGFADAQGRRAALVYLYKQGTFYPFAPLPGAGPRHQQRDVILERQVKDAVAGDLPIEPDPGRWLPVWGAPGL